MVRPIGKTFLAALTCAALLCAQGWIGAASAVEWPTWPRPPAKPTQIAPEPAAPSKAPAPAPKAPPPASAAPASPAAAKAGEAAGKKTDGGIRAGTVAKWALVAAGIAGIAIAVGGGGGGTSSNH